MIAEILELTDDEITEVIAQALSKSSVDFCGLVSDMFESIEDQHLPEILVL